MPGVQIDIWVCLVPLLALVLFDLTSELAHPLILTLLVFGKITSCYQLFRPQCRLARDAPVRTAIFQSYMHPYMSVNYGVKHFRHALAIDERRSIFRPNMWSELTVEREQELDVDLPAPRDDPSTQRDGWKYRAPQRDHADIKEVWFAGDLT